MIGAAFEFYKLLGLYALFLTLLVVLPLGGFLYSEHTKELAREQRNAAMKEAVTSIREGRPGRAAAAARTAKAQTLHGPGAADTPQ